MCIYIYPDSVSMFLCVSIDHKEKRMIILLHIYIYIYNCLFFALLIILPPRDACLNFKFQLYSWFKETIL